MGSQRGMILVRSPIPCSEPDIEAEGTLLANKTMRLLLAAAVGWAHDASRDVA